tara:strand:+ start:12688 stop:15126 length:2439 start_codon:yes stop_codon:yes gene_type:complete
MSEFEDEMRVIKRNGNYETISFDKILHRVRNIGNEAKVQINYTPLVMKIIDQLYDGIHTSKIDELTAEQCASQTTTHTDFGKLASYLIISNHHKNTKSSFYEVMKELHEFKDINNKQSSLISDTFMNNVNMIKEQIEEIIDYKLDFLIDYFGFKTLERAYLFKIDKKVVERPQHMWMRVAICIHGTDIEKIKSTYYYMSNKYFTHATPTLFNAGTSRPQMSSCYLLAMEDDSITGIYDTLKDCANISKYAGGIGLHIHNVRSTGSHIRGTNGTSNGIVPMLRVFNNTARYVDQGGGKRNGSFAIYLEPWHGDIEVFLEMRKNHGDEEARARDLFYALWIPDLFMERVEKNDNWTLMCPDECPGLSDCYGEKFNELYTSYEQNNKGRKTVNARELWFKILDSQMETGTPYLLYKDSCNQKSNQQNLGTIKSSNLCTEIIEYSDDTETAVCNLASIALSAFVKNKEFDFDELYKVTQLVTFNLNKIIDINFYPTEKTKKSNLRHRPIGIGVQGLADTFAMLDIPFHSDEARKLNEEIFETMYYASLEMSNIISRDIAFKLDEEIPRHRYGEDGILCDVNIWEKHLLNKSYKGAYSSFEGSPISKGIFQFDMWNKKPATNRYDWNKLKENIMYHGIRNSLLMAPMPTASTSQILGNNECFEPFTSNIYSRSTLAGEFMLVNKHMMKDLLDLGLWDENIKNNIILNKGSIQQIEIIPQKIKDKYKTVWEIPMKHIINMAADRGKYICQSQSLNLWLEEPNYNNLTSMHFYSWKQGLKTGIYYLRRRGKHQAQQFTINPEKTVDSQQEDEICEMCSA